MVSVILVTDNEPLFLARSLHQIPIVPASFCGFFTILSLPVVASNLLQNLMFCISYSFFLEPLFVILEIVILIYHGCAQHHPSLSV